MPWWDAIGGSVMAYVLSKIYLINLTHSDYLLAIGFSFLPDLDLAIWLISHNFKINKWTHQHRKILHHPIVYLSLGLLIIWPLTNQFYAILFLLCSLTHFLHDSVAIGWGIKWLSPFSRKNYKFFTYKHLGEKRRLLVCWTPEELILEVEKRNNWFKGYYLLL